MKRIFTLILLLVSLQAAAQVPKKVVVEHFTNTYCSVCASRNPGFYDNLKQFPQVLHIAYHPSSPYTGCPLNKHNKSENDDRTNFYGIYGATPRLVMQGAVISGSASYDDPALFNTQLGQTTPFELKLRTQMLSNNTAYVTAVVKRVAAGGPGAVQLYGMLVEDTLSFAAKNGEGKHFDVFRKAIWGSQPINISMPANVGDSMVSGQSISINSEWEMKRVYAIALLQDANKAVVQAEKSNHLAATLDVSAMPDVLSIEIYPNPARDVLHITQGIVSFPFTITDLRGVVLHTGVAKEFINISELSKGLYFLSLKTAERQLHFRFVKE